MNTFKNWPLFRLLPILVYTLYFIGCSHSYVNGSELQPLIMRLILGENDLKGTEKEIVRVKDFYKDYKFYISEDLFIDMDKEFTIKPDDIKGISITKPPWVPKDSTNFEIQIRFKDDIGNILTNFTQSNLNRKVAVEIDKNLFMIVNIMEPIKTDLAMPTVEYTLEELTTQFKKITNEISYQVN